MTVHTAARPRASRPPLTTGTIGLLNTEWATLGATVIPAPWRAAPTLAGFATAEDVLAGVRAAPQAARRDALLHALLALHAAGDQLAGRTVLQAMLGKATRMAYTAKKRGTIDPFETVIAAMWETIRTYPLHRASSVAGNLALDTLRRLGPAATAREIPAGLQAETHPDPGGASHPRRAADSPETNEVFDAVLPRTLGWALEHDVLTPAEVRLLARLHLDDNEPTLTMRELAGRMGITHAALRQRHSRAIRALAAAITTRLDEPAA
ncbi:hypothetical protein [Intrasporangium sp.]|uniref:hypothetical protein n=1 Tax=Intrasporangium sp. TaxID=1925024 RepID=UPI003221E513